MKLQINPSSMSQSFLASSLKILMLLKRSLPFPIYTSANFDKILK